jgi:CheY-like chemotaxis protein
MTGGCRARQRLAPAGSLNPRAGVPAPLETTAVSGALSVLVVDDHLDYADMLAFLVQLVGHDSRVAYDGAAALALVAERPADVVLLDLGMPGMDGYEVARKLRQLPGMAGALVVCVSGYGRDEDRRRALEAGCDTHLLKPADPLELLALLAQRARELGLVPAGD